MDGDRPGMRYTAPIMAILPLHDDTPLRRIRRAYVCMSMITVCVMVFIYELTLSGAEIENFILAFGAIPRVLLGGAHLDPGIKVIPGWATLFSSMFVHGGFMHLAGNMLFLWVLGENIEDAMGHSRFVRFYLLCGVTAALAHAGTDIWSEAPMVGASGAISGVIGAYLVLHPRAPIRTLVWYFIIWLPAWLVLGFWIGFQFLSAALAAGGLMGADGGGVAWWAHIAGFFTGAILIVFMRDKEVPLFDKGYTRVDHRVLVTKPRSKKQRHR